MFRPRTPALAGAARPARRAGRDRRGLCRRGPRRGGRGGDFAPQGRRRCGPTGAPPAGSSQGPGACPRRAPATGQRSRGRAQARTAQTGAVPAAVVHSRRTLASCPTPPNRRGGNTPCPAAACAAASGSAGGDGPQIASRVGPRRACPVHVSLAASQGAPPALETAGMHRPIVHPARGRAGASAGAHSGRRAGRRRRRRPREPGYAQVHLAGALL